MPLGFVAAIAAWQLGDIGKALTLALGCHRQEPMNGTVAEMLASLYAQAGDLAESLYFGKLATALKPDAAMATWLPPEFPTFDDAFLNIQDKPLLGQSRRLLETGRLNEALDKARQHVEVAPDDDVGRQFYGEALLRGGFADAAVATLSPFVDRGNPPAPAASALARAWAAVGDGAPARQWHDYASAADPADAVIAAARIADAPWLGWDAAEAAAASADWLSRFARPGKTRHWRPAGDRLAIGYLVSSFRDRKDALAVAAVARAHARRGQTVIGYGVGNQSWEENAVLGGAFDKWRDVSAVDAATLAKMLTVDGLDVVVDVAGFAAPTGLQALARTTTAVRVAWLGETAGLERSVYDAAIASRAARASAIERWQAGSGAYPLIRNWSDACERADAANIRFGADATMAQVDDATAQLWRSVLAAVPDAVLLLRANDIAVQENIARLVGRFGDAAARVDIVDSAAPEGFYAQVDVALAPRIGVSPRMVGEALACGVPVVALDDGGPWQPYGAMLRDLGLGELVAATAAAYVDVAAALAAADGRAPAAAKALAIAKHGENTAGEIAAAVEQGARNTLGRAAA